MAAAGMKLIRMVFQYFKSLLNEGLKQIVRNMKEYLLLQFDHFSNVWFPCFVVFFEICDYFEQMLVIIRKRPLLCKLGKLKTKIKGDTP